MGKRISVILIVVLATAAVETRTGEAGLPVPYSVELEGTYSQALSAYIADELNIPPERQVWNEQEN